MSTSAESCRLNLVAAGMGRPSRKGEQCMDNPIYTYYRENLEAVSKEQLLEALKNALQSAECWRGACLNGLSVQAHEQGSAT